jgi:hypothetical protein
MGDITESRMISLLLHGEESEEMEGDLLLMCPIEGESKTIRDL